MNPHNTKVDSPLLQSYQGNWIGQSWSWCLNWFDTTVNYMKLNEETCHFLLAGNTPELLWAKVEEEIIWESNSEKLLGLVIDKNLHCNKYLTILCKKVSGKVSALARMVKIIPFNKKGYY